MFGMGTGGSSLPSSPLWLYIPLPRYTYFFIVPLLFTKVLELKSSFKKINNYIANFTKGKIISILLVFENTEGWSADGTSISATDLEDPAMAAEYLSSTYYIYYWKRS